MKEEGIEAEAKKDSKKSYNNCECKTVKNIIKINDRYDTIEINCPKHGEIIMSIKEYFQKEIKKWYDNETIIYNDKSKENKIPKDSQLHELKSKKEKLLNKIQNENYFIQLLDILINGYEKNPSNKFNNNNIINISNTIKEELTEKKLLSKIEQLEKKILQYLNIKLGVNLSNDVITINLNGKNVTDLELNLLGGVEFKNCESIDFSNNKITNISSFEINSPKLKNINFSNNKIEDISPLKKILKLNVNLESINLNNNSIKKVNVKEMNDNIFQRIKEINLDGNKYIQKEFHEIKELLSFNKVLREGSGCVLKYKLDKNKIRLFGKEFVSNNKDICRMIIHEKEEDLCEFYEKKEDIKDEILYVKLKFTDDLKDLSHMFRACKSLISVSDISKWDTSQVTNMRYMFEQCESLKNFPDISEWDTSNVNDISCMFQKCKNTKLLPDIGKWNTSNITDMSYLFYLCESLEKLPNIGNWNISNVSNIFFMFSQCSSILYLPNLSKWNISNVSDLSNMFEGCSKITALCDISNWNTSNIIDMESIFSDCKSLKSLPDISKWNTKNLKNISNMFSGCSSLKYLPDISKWDTKNLNNISNLFSGCSSLKYLPDINKWDISKVTNKEDMFKDISKEIPIPRKFK